MKKIFLSAIVLTLLSISFFTFGQNVQKLDEKNGYKELKFGLPYDSLKQFLVLEPTRVEKDGDKTLVYLVSNIEHFEIEGVRIKSIRTEFFDNQLSSITIVIEEPSSANNFLDILQTAYGKGKFTSSTMKIYSWEGNKVKLSYLGSSKQTTVFFISLPISKKQDEFQEKLQKKNSKEAIKKL